MAVSELINLSALLNNAKCFDLVSQHRWPQGVTRRSRIGSVTSARPVVNIPISLRIRYWPVITNRWGSFCHASTRWD